MKKRDHGVREGHEQQDRLEPTEVDPRTPPVRQPDDGTEQERPRHQDHQALVRSQRRDQPSAVDAGNERGDRDDGDGGNGRGPPHDDRHDE